MRSSNGSSLSVDSQLCWSFQSSLLFQFLFFHNHWIIFCCNFAPAILYFAETTLQSVLISMVMVPKKFYCWKYERTSRKTNRFGICILLFSHFASQETDPSSISEVLIQMFKGSPYPSHFIFEINVGKMRIRHTMTLKMNDEFLDRLKIYWKFKFTVVVFRIRLFPTLISKIKWLGSELPLK